MDNIDPFFQNTTWGTIAKPANATRKFVADAPPSVQQDALPLRRPITNSLWPAGGCERRGGRESEEGVRSNDEEGMKAKQEWGAARVMIDFLSAENAGGNCVFEAAGVPLPAPRIGGNVKGNCLGSFGDGGGGCDAGKEGWMVEVAVGLLKKKYESQLCF
ncbi:hypothetical protein GWI33_014387 [Rhynchophorus ferrugineus]|uniref:Uncharacterized protein n=1 Tax=Rhynchophorus ferrugineus TaxID=354439 RepID=A0A834I7G7_RHYFE|nr:hypothetical protein GWI33_014387 [Rhynchophorus ferrugineus]